MSRKLRVPKPQVDALPCPAWTFALLTGQDPQCRLPGWLSQLQGEAGQHGEPGPADVSAQHEAALIAEAAAHGFDPFFLTHRRPTGLGFEAWRTAFLAAHSY